MATETSTAETPAPPPQESIPASRDRLADKIIRENVLWATGGSLIPVPTLDVVAITVVELKMLRELAQLYEVPFREDQVKSILVSVMTGIGAPAFGAAIGSSVFKFIPVAGLLIGWAATSGVTAAFTYAVGKLFLQHFASGGTFLDFDPEKVRGHFARQFEEGKLIAAKIKPVASQKTETPVKPA
jgi:uncharacterized protein (DUF697 family)